MVPPGRVKPTPVPAIFHRLWSIMTPGRGRADLLQLTLACSSLCRNLLHSQASPPGMKGVWEVLEPGQQALQLSCSCIPSSSQSLGTVFEACRERGTTAGGHVPPAASRQLFFFWEEVDTSSNGHSLALVLPKTFSPDMSLCLLP